MSNAFPTLASCDQCTNCEACVNSCNHDALKLTAYSDGFYYPQLNKDKCIGCMLCERACPIIPKNVKTQNESTKTSSRVYACWNNNKQIRRESSSAGAFSAIAESVINKGGIVYGCAYNDNMEAQHRSIESVDEIHLLRGSKYVQSKIGTTFKEIRNQLRTNRQVLFVGTPCQVMGLKSYLRKDYDNLLTCDFICHGTPSPILFGKYLGWIEKRKNIKVNNFSFRNKKKGWNDPLRVANNSVVMKNDNDVYYNWFKLAYSMRSSCYACPSLGTERNSDITLADYWGIGMHYKLKAKSKIHEGVSALMVNSEKAEIVFNELTSISSEERILEEVLIRNTPMIKSSRRPAERDSFYLEMEKLSFDSLVDKYYDKSLSSRKTSILREYFPRFILINLRRFAQLVSLHKSGNRELNKHSK